MENDLTEHARDALSKRQIRSGLESGDTYLNSVARSQA
jgi:hypothetical protein